MGDLLQMTPFLNGFRQDYPNVQITLLVLKEFHEICQGFLFIDDIETFDGHDYLSKLEDPNGSLIENFRVLGDLVEKLRQKRFDTVINLTFSRLSALLTYLLRVRDVRGITIDDFGNRLVKNPWINHFYNIVTKREINLFNYVDFIRKAGGSEHPSRMGVTVPERDRGFARAFYDGRGVSDADFVIGFQPGASRDSRRWPTQFFGDLAAELIQEGSKIILFGSSAEKELGGRVKEGLACHMNPMKSHFFDMIGQTSVNQLAALVERCDLLVTGDTGTMHVATAVGTRVVALFFGPAYFPETGPYGDDHVVIQTQMGCAPCEHNIRCKNPQCRESIRVSHVLQVIYSVRKGSFEKGHHVEDGPSWSGIQLYRGFFDEDHMFEFRPMIRRPLERMDLIRQIYREMWKLVLDDRPGEINSDRINRKIQCLFNVNGSPPQVEEDGKAFDGIAELARQGMEISQRLIQWSENIEQNLAAIKTAGQVVHDIDEQIELQGMTHQACHPLAYMFRQGKENLEEGDVSLLSKRTLKLYETLYREATLMRRGLAKAVASIKGSS
jgi:ADP-heptose:LPS heptosyltransferase